MTIAKLRVTGEKLKNDNNNDPIINPPTSDCKWEGIVKELIKNGNTQKLEIVEESEGKVSRLTIDYKVERIEPVKVHFKENKDESTEIDHTIGKQRRFTTKSENPKTRYRDRENDRETSTSSGQRQKRRRRRMRSDESEFVPKVEDKPKADNTYVSVRNMTLKDKTRNKGETNVD